MLVLPAICGALVMGLLDGSDAAAPETLEEEDNDKKIKMVPNPLYGVWLAQDQQVLVSNIVLMCGPQLWSFLRRNLRHIVALLQTQRN
jgi:hypothetical protein